MGESAGSVAAPLYAGLVSDRLPDARITVLGDGSGSYPDVPRLNEIIAAWGFGNAIPPWPENAGLDRRAVERSGALHPERTARPRDRLRPPRLRLRRAAAALVPDRRHPCGRSSVADRRQRDPDRGRRREPAQLHRAGRRAHRLNDGTFYTETVNGQPLVDWVTRLVNHQLDADVHCEECRAG